MRNPSLLHLYFAFTSFRRVSMFILVCILSLFNDFILFLNVLRFMFNVNLVIDVKRHNFHAFYFFVFFFFLVLFFLHNLINRRFNIIWWVLNANLLHSFRVSFQSITFSCLFLMQLNGIQCNACTNNKNFQVSAIKKENMHSILYTVSNYAICFALINTT